MLILGELCSHLNVCRTVIAILSSLIKFYYSLSLGNLNKAGRANSNGRMQGRGSVLHELHRMAD
jgi:hypothetical protein